MYVVKLLIMALTVGFFLGFTDTAFSNYPWPVALLAVSSWLLFLIVVTKEIFKED